MTLTCCLIFKKKQLLQNNKDEVDISNKAATKIWGPDDDSGTVIEGVYNFLV